MKYYTKNRARLIIDSLNLWDLHTIPLSALQQKLHAEYQRLGKVRLAAAVNQIVVTSVGVVRLSDKRGRSDN